MLIADSVELTMRGHCYDALVGLAGCDKSLPGMMMVMVRLNVPSVFMYGGSILPGRFKGKDVTVQDVFEAVGAAQRRHHVGRGSAPEAGVRRLSLGGFLRRPVHRQHHGLRVRGDRPALHLPAMASEAGIDFDLFDVADIFKDTPYIADLKPGGKYVAKDMY